MSYTITETLDTLNKTGYLMIDINEINNIKMKTEKYTPKQGEIIWVWDIEREEKVLRVFKELDKSDGICIVMLVYMVIVLNNLYQVIELFWSCYSKHEGKFHNEFKPQNTLLNFNQY
jgi:nitrate reductase NapAB chaperone NapD